MKERLTKRVGNGVQYDNREYIITCYPENNNLNPVDKMAVKLCELEDKIESNILIELPCAVGDTVYKIWSCGKSGKSIAEFVVTHIDIDNYPSIEVVYRKPYSKSTYCHYFAKSSDFGKTVFLTKEEAEKALAERSEGK